ncbi:hypothetical protein PoB_005369700 [Plakobranchus ocellatus]|uniref:Uncharacterized protein n=1 Tax=Plakobranchus ocellatus TaxID=259542 RepID=A0AAV4C6H8_9GAST|nr:hypothetical protein PoB_005369700 [Plakobranchus ocellatus]
MKPEFWTPKERKDPDRPRFSLTMIITGISILALLTAASQHRQSHHSGITFRVEINSFTINFTPQWTSVIMPISKSPFGHLQGLKLSKISLLRY